MEKAYLDALRNIREHGIDREGRNGATRALFALQIRLEGYESHPAIKAEMAV